MCTCCAERPQHPMAFLCVGQWHFCDACRKALFEGKLCTRRLTTREGKELKAVDVRGGRLYANDIEIDYTGPEVRSQWPKLEGCLALYLLHLEGAPVALVSSYERRWVVREARLCSTVEATLQRLRKHDAARTLVDATGARHVFTRGEDRHLRHNGHVVAWFALGARWFHRPPAAPKRDCDLLIVGAGPHRLVGVFMM